MSVELGGSLRQTIALGCEQPVRGWCMGPAALGRFLCAFVYRCMYVHQLSAAAEQLPMSWQILHSSVFCGARHHNQMLRGPRP